MGRPERHRLGQRGRRSALSRDLFGENVAGVGIAAIPERHRLVQVVGEGGPASLHRREPAQQLYAHRLQDAVVEIMATIAAGRLHVGEERRAAGEGSALSGASKKAVSLSQVTMSRPSGRRGSHGARPQARNTSRPDRRRSSAIWQPVWPLPITNVRRREAHPAWCTPRHR